MTESRLLQYRDACHASRADLGRRRRIVTSHLRCRCIAQEIYERDASAVLLFFTSVFLILAGLVSLAFAWPRWLVACLGDGDRAICGPRAGNTEYVGKFPLAEDEEDGEGGVNECIRCSWGCSQPKSNERVVAGGHRR